MKSVYATLNVEPSNYENETINTEITLLYARNLV